MKDLVRFGVVKSSTGIRMNCFTSRWELRPSTPRCREPWEFRKQRQLLCPYLLRSVALWPVSNTSTFPWCGAWFCLFSRIRWFVVIFGRARGEVDRHMGIFVSVLEQYRLQVWMLILVCKVVPLLLLGGGKQSFICGLRAGPASPSVSLGPQLESLSPFPGIRKLIIGTEEKIKANKAKTRREEFCMKYNYERSYYHTLIL